MIVTILINGKKRKMEREGGGRRKDRSIEERKEEWRERQGKGGEQRKSRRKCKSESDIGGNYTILLNRLVYYNVILIQILHESNINCQYKHVCESPLTLNIHSTLTKERRRRRKY